MIFDWSAMTAKLARTAKISKMMPTFIAQCWRLSVVKAMCCPYIKVLMTGIIKRFGGPLLCLNFNHGWRLFLGVNTSKADQVKN